MNDAAKVARWRTLTNRKWACAIMRECGHRRLCEVGVRRGNNLRQMLRARPQIAVAVDSWREDGDPGHNDKGYAQAALDEMYRDVCRMIVDHPAVHPLRMYSTEAAAIFPDGFFDYVYLDADHSLAGVRADLAAWWPKIAPCGVLGGHDYVDYVSPETGVKFGVIQAVNEFVQREGLAAYFHETSKFERFANWWAFKPSGQ